MLSNLVFFQHDITLAFKKKNLQKRGGCETFKNKLAATGGFLQFCTFRLKAAGEPGWCLGRVSPGEEPFPRWGHPNHSPIMASFLANQSIIPCQSQHHSLPI
jgi:hypothetical protein